MTREKPEEWPACFFSFFLSLSQAEAQQRSKRLVDSEQNLLNKEWGTLTDDKKYQQLQSHEAQMTLIRMLESDSDLCGFHQSTQYRTVIRSKAREERGGAWKPSIL